MYASRGTRSPPRTLGRPHANECPHYRRPVHRVSWARAETRPWPPLQHKLGLVKPSSWQVDGGGALSARCRVCAVGQTPERTRPRLGQSCDGHGCERVQAGSHPPGHTQQRLMQAGVPRGEATTGVRRRFVMHRADATAGGRLTRAGIRQRVRTSPEHAHSSVCVRTSSPVAPGHNQLFLGLCSQSREDRSLRIDLGRRVLSGLPHCLQQCGLRCHPGRPRRRANRCLPLAPFCVPRPEPHGHPGAVRPCPPAGARHFVR